MGAPYRNDEDGLQARLSVLEGANARLESQNADLEKQLSWRQSALRSDITRWSLRSTAVFGAAVALYAAIAQNNDPPTLQPSDHVALIVFLSGGAVAVLAVIALFTQEVTRE